MEKIVDDKHLRKVNKVIIASIFVAIAMHLGYVIFKITLLKNVIRVILLLLINIVSIMLDLSLIHIYQYNITKIVKRGQHNEKNTYDNSIS